MDVDDEESEKSNTIFMMLHQGEASEKFRVILRKHVVMSFSPIFSHLTSSTL